MRTTFILSLIAVGVLCAIASANPVQFKFDASDFLNVTAGVAGDAATQADGRRVRAYDSSGNLADLYSTWTQGTAITGDIAAYNTWKNSLTSSEGISEFSIWLVPDAFGGTNPDASNNYNTKLGYAVAGGNGWGADGRGQVLYGAGPDGWSFKVAYYGNIPLPTWYTTDPSKYLRPGEDLGNAFTLGANLAYWNGGTASDVVVGNSYRMWFWSDSGSESLGTTGLPTENTFQFTGVNNPNLGGSDGSEVDFRAFMNLTAQTTPEPATMSMLVLGGLALIRRKK
jgi:hypothetical protein